ncbi:hypothetical protein AALN73_05765 [Bacteroides stercorirosoris]|uniref:hypothetical protein n=1 Tax=Bacteroides stercorirosoris TaxID=871324 RepID=UPI003517C636
MDNLVGDIGNWSSIIGLVVSIITILYARSIKDHVDEVQKRILYNTRLEVHVANLRDKNFTFLNSLDESDKNIIRQLLKSLETNIQLIHRIVPKEQKVLCKNCIKILSRQYRSNLILSSEDEYKKGIFSQNVNNDALYKTYIEVSSLIDILESLKIDKEIVS